MDTIHNRPGHRKFSRSAEETLDVWLALYISNANFTKQHLKALEAREKSCLNEDGSPKREPSKGELDDYFRQMEEIQKVKPLRITRRDEENMENGIITKKIIKQLQNLIGNRSKPRSKKDRHDLYTLLKYGRIYSD